MTSADEPMTSADEPMTSADEPMTSAGEPMTSADEPSLEQPVPAEVVAAAMAGLDDLATIPIAEHVERFDRVHSALTAALSAVDPPAVDQG